jgi:hypothetical protein
MCFMKCSKIHIAECCITGTQGDTGRAPACAPSVNGSAASGGRFLISGRRDLIRAG